MDVQNTQQQKRILIVEDDKYIRDLYVDILSEEGYAITPAADGDEGYKAMLAGGFDVVLLDIMLPKMDGITILKKLTLETPPILPNRTIIILSNIGQDDMINQAMSSGANGYMVKSDNTPDEVVKQVKKFIEHPATAI